MTMKNLILLLCAATFLVSCEDIQDNSSEFQGEIDGTFFQASTVTARKNADRSYTFTGENASETIEFTVESIGAGIFPLGPGSVNNAKFTDASGGVYSTDFSGSEGEIIVSRFDTAGPTETGTFSFTAVRPGIDTVRISRGLFFEVFVDRNVNPEADDDPVDPTNAGTFVAEIDDDLFNTQIVSANSGNNSIIVTGVAGGRSLSITIPLDATEGSYSIPEGGFAAAYVEGSLVEEASSGTVVILTHDTGNNVLKGAFTFQTATHNVTLGQFNVTYQ